MKADLPSPETLRKLLRYEPETGKLFWRERERSMFPTNRSWKWWNKRFADTEALAHISPYGYRQGAIFNRTHQAHRVIWALQTGSWPTDQIDHIDRNPSNNKLSNLRPASNAQNNANKPASLKSRSAFKGVSWHIQNKVWQAQITQNRKCFYLGCFPSEIEAAKAYDAEAIKMHGEFANLNFPERKVA